MRLLIGSCLAILVILTIVLMAKPAAMGMAAKDTFMHRYCPEGYYSAMQQSLAVRRGGPAEQFNIVCVPENQIVYADSYPFVHNYRPQYDRLRQDPYVMVYYG